MNKTQKIEAIYARIPKIACKGKCQAYCGPIGLTTAELARLGGRISVTPSLQCSLLSADGRCTVYEHRPLVCFAPDAWIFTAVGPKRISTVLPGDHVYAKDGRLHRVLATRSSFYTGPLLNMRFTGTHVSCRCTPDHLWWAFSSKDKRSKVHPAAWRPAQDLRIKKKQRFGDYVAFPRVLQDGPDCEHLETQRYVQGQEHGARLLPYTSGKLFAGRIAHSIPLHIPIDPDFLFLIGLYLAEGNSTFQSAGLVMHREESPMLERVARYLTALGIPSHFTIKRNALTLRVDSCLFARLMASLCGKLASEKRIAHDLMGRLSHRQKWNIYEAWDAGDGRKCIREKEMSTTTISDELAVQMSFIALCHGLFPRVYRSRHATRIGSISWDVHLFPSNWRTPHPGFGTKNILRGEYVFSPVAEPESEFYAGPVIDLSIEGEESFVTSSGIAHNCRLWGVTEDMPCPYGCEAERILTVEEGKVLGKELHSFAGKIVLSDIEGRKPRPISQVVLTSSLAHRSKPVPQS